MSTVVGRVRVAAGPGAVGLAAGEVGQHPAGLGEADLAAAAGDQVAQGLGDVCLAHPDGYPRLLTRPHHCHHRLQS